MENCSHSICEPSCTGNPHSLLLLISLFRFIGKLVQAKFYFIVVFNSMWLPHISPHPWSLGWFLSIYIILIPLLPIYCPMHLNTQGLHRLATMMEACLTLTNAALLSGSNQRTVQKFHILRIRVLFVYLSPFPPLTFFLLSDYANFVRLFFNPAKLYVDFFQPYPWSSSRWK